MNVKNLKSNETYIHAPMHPGKTSVFHNFRLLSFKIISLKKTTGVSFVERNCSQATNGFGVGWDGKIDTKQITHR